MNVLFTIIDLPGMFSLHSHLLWDFLLFFLVTAYVIVCPFTKVEESFAVQACHDLIAHQTNITAYDHLEFSGVVPRSFLGPLSITMFSAPFLFLASRVLPMLVSANTALLFLLPKLYMLYVLRIILGLANVCSFSFFRRSLSKRFGDARIATATALVSLCQFHFIFYQSRPLANMFALVFTNIACGCLLRRNIHHAVCWLALASIVFRCDVVLFAGPLLIGGLLTDTWADKGGRVAVFVRVVLFGLGSSVASIALSVAVDSFFWRRLLWPEGEVWWYNVVDNKSSDWGYC